MTLRTDLTDATANVGVHAAQHNEANQAILDLQARIPLGLTGATAATRYVGGTTSGAPASGTFALGDFVIDQTGLVWVCTTAGSPGTWANASRNTELAYAENRSGTNITTTAQATATDITSCSITVPASTFPVYLACSMLVSVNAVTNVSSFITEVSNGVDTPITRQRTYAEAVSGGFVVMDWETRLGTTARSRTFKLQASKGSSTSSTLTVYAPDNSTLNWDLCIKAYTK